MIKLLIADDEPLVQIGVKSMINWEKLGIELVGTASNGAAAYEMIEKFRPEIVLTDIQMPVLSGLEMARKCRSAFGDLPAFIILTSYESFPYAREAISLHAVEYLLKLDLTPESLEETLCRAIDQVNRQKAEIAAVPSDSFTDMQLFHERFFIRLLNNLYENEEQARRQAHSLNIRLDCPGYAAAQVEVAGGSSIHTQEQALTLYNSTIQMFQNLISKHLHCQTVALDVRYFAVIFFLDDDATDTWKSVINDSLTATFAMLHNYYSVSLTAGVGRLVHRALDLSSSWYDAKQAASLLDSKRSVLFYDDSSVPPTLRNVFNLSLFRRDICSAFEELDETALREILSTITDLLTSDGMHYAQALDAASSILHLALTLLPNGSEVISGIYQSETDNYHSLYRQKSVPGVISWLHTLEDGLCASFLEQKSGQKNKLVENVKKYIQENLCMRLSLQDIAQHFSVSPNHLSQLFKKTCDIGLNEYINHQKISRSKELLRDSNLKIYEIADQLGFESAFYFSKVFKKVTGMSPRDYQNRSV